MSCGLGLGDTWLFLLVSFDDDNKLGLIFGCLVRWI